MAKPQREAFFVTAKWDDEAKVYRSESNIIGLHIETAKLAEFEEVMADFATELIIDNHLTDAELTGKSFRELLAGIFIRYNPPQSVGVAAKTTLTIPSCRKARGFGEGIAECGAAFG